VAGGPVVVVLAAGRGERFAGRSDARGHKLEQAFAGTTVLGATISCAIRSGLPVVVVTVPRLFETVSLHVPRQDIIVLPDGTDPGQLRPLGMGDSIMSGVTARSHADGWLILPGDMPLVQPATLRAVAEALPQHLAVYAQHRGRRGHPVGFGPELYSELAILSGDEGARRLLVRYPAHGVEVPDEGALMDVDTETDLHALRGAHAAQGAASPV
jgi:molybdenum cofactor cytidylyltransferase